MFPHENVYLKNVDLEERIILGIDPGTKIMGYGIIKALGNEPRFISMGECNFSKIQDQTLAIQFLFIYKFLEW